MMTSTVKPKAFLRVLMAVASLYLCLPVTAQTLNDTSNQTVIYRGNQGRTGWVEAQGITSLTGSEWQKSIGEAGISSPLFADDTIYIGTNRGELLAFDAVTSDERWSFKSIGGNASTPAIAGDTIYVGLGLDPNTGMGLYALDRQTGKPLWSFKTDSPIWLTSPLIANGKIYFGDLDGNFYAVDLQTHEQVWSIDVQRSVYWNASADEDTIYFTAMGTMYAVDAYTGEQRWQIARSQDWAPLTVDHQVVYAGNLNHEFYALDAKTGQEIWRFKDKPTDRANWSAPAVADDVVYAGNRTGNMYAFDAETGKPLWNFKASAPPTSDPLITNGVLYFGVGAHGNESAAQDEGSFYALDIQTGKALWTFQSQGEIFNGPAVSGTNVYFITAAGLLYKLH